jgi:superfamily I DNA/RNA helicase
MQISDTASTSAGKLAAPSASAASAGSGRTDAPSFQQLLSELTDFMGNSPADAMRSEILAQLGITKEQLEKMTPAEREKVEARISDLLKKEMEAKVQQDMQAQQQAQVQQSGTQFGSSTSPKKHQSIDISV